ncbi:MAG: hypothetical protein MUF64_03340, partial [Polyangiaceae bacterium]|nr:hypothetical protein [Polyangiaceae bacterium]
DRGEVHSAGASLVGVAVSMNWTLLLFFGPSSFFFTAASIFLRCSVLYSPSTRYTYPVDWIIEHRLRKIKGRGTLSLRLLPMRS